jgi:hypothetical protein
MGRGARQDESGWIARDVLGGVALMALSTAYATLFPSLRRARA